MFRSPACILTLIILIDLKKMLIDTFSFYPALSFEVHSQRKIFRKRIDVDATDSLKGRYMQNSWTKL